MRRAGLYSWLWLWLGIVFLIGYALSPTDAECVGFFASLVMGKLYDLEGRS